MEYTGYNLNVFLSDFLNTEYIIGTRFHSIILGWLANIPVFPIVYNLKTYNAIKSYGFKGNYVNIESVNCCNLDFISSNNDKNYRLNCTNLIKKSNLQFRFLDNFYSKGKIIEGV